MNPLRSLGWILLLTSWLAGGCAPNGDAGLPQKPRKLAEGPGRAPAPAPAAASVAPAAPLPAAAPAQPAGAEELPRGWPWIVDDDEFEGEGWTFWPLPGPKR